MLGSAQSVTPKPAAMPPAAPPTQPGTAGGPSFAHFLNDRPDPQPAHTDPAPSAPDASRDAAAAANAAQARRKEANAAPPKPAPGQGRTPEAAAQAKPAEAAKANDADDEVADATDDTDAQTSGLNEFTQLIGLTPPAQQALQAHAQAAATAPSDAAADTRHSVKGAHAGHPVATADAAGDDEPARDAGTATPAERRPAARTADAPRAKGVELPAADKTAAARGAHGDALQAATTAPNAAGPRAVAAPDAQPTAFAALLAQSQPAGVAAPGTTPVSAGARVHAALQSSAFAPELGARVSLLAVDGVQQAELQLNPADMGPVAVQIVVDGAQAQVSFHAAQAETRQALQQSLPELAAALQGQGLTLAGGGVFQQASQDGRHGEAQADGPEGSGSRTAGSGGGADGGTAVAPPARRVVGLLDTFA
ncbi:flagellar hook-length control protein FliK [Roseateles sp.]|uniref:flagellar hook-length control protein FliK n=1 Tax=Roseateles sp. TaxID=1971397 RepID=UPI0025E5D67F|nr:flagellar hook-length control protein FliK [Roseateles sp.]MBV8034389.1 flagellar hook-length control protein FliK [Roseateles sp.]